MWTYCHNLLRKPAIHMCVPLTRLSLWLRENCWSKFTCKRKRGSEGSNGRPLVATQFSAHICLSMNLCGVMLSLDAIHCHCDFRNRVIITNISVCSPSLCLLILKITVFLTAILDFLMWKPHAHIWNIAMHYV